METMERMPFADGNNIFGKFENMVSYASLSKEERHSYDQSLKAYRDYINQIDYAKEEGLAEGRAKGLTEGLVKGRAEERLLIAKELLSKGMDMDFIKSVIHLSDGDLNELQ